MEVEEIKLWFWSQSAADRAACLLDLMHMMTVDFRGVALDQPSDVIIEVAKKFNEVIHGLSGYAASTLGGVEHVPEEGFIESIILRMQDADLRPFLYMTLQEVERLIKRSTAA